MYKVLTVLISFLLLPSSLPAPQAKSVDDWVYKKTAETYALDPEMRERLATLNPQAIKNIVGRMLEAHGRGMWKADQNMIDELQEIYADLEDRLEGMADE